MTYVECVVNDKQNHGQLIIKMRPWVFWHVLLKIYIKPLGETTDHESGDTCLVYMYPPLSMCGTNMVSQG